MLPVLTTASSITCSHAGKATHIPAPPPRVFVDGMPVLVQTDSNTVIGCPFTIPTGKPSPCTTLRWTVAAKKVLVGGKPVLTEAAVGLGFSPEQAPQGPPIATAIQQRVRAL